MTPAVAPWLPPELRAYQAAVARSIEGLEPSAVPAWVADVAASHERDIDLGSICLYAGTNVMSPRARAMLSTTLGSLPSMGPLGAKYQTGVWWIERLEVLAAEHARRIFGARFAETRLPSGSMANLAVYAAFTRPGDTIVVVPERAGGHTSHHVHGMPGVRGLKVVDMPFDRDRMTVDVAGMREVVARERPAVVVAGASLMLAPHPVAEIADAAHAVGATVLFDAAHVAGLVAGGSFQRPLAEGADVMTCSTYKSFGGPPGGLVLCDDERIAEAVDQAAYPGLTANYDASRLAALCVAEAEVLAFWEAYAHACIANARALAEGLAGQGFSVVGNGHSFTDSHHVAIDAGALGGGGTVAGRLEAASILSSAIGLPGDPDVDRPTGVRLGTQVVTRWGLGPTEMATVASMMADVLLRDAPPAPVAVAVRELRDRFTTIGYCFA